MYRVYRSVLNVNQPYIYSTRSRFSYQAHPYTIIPNNNNNSTPDKKGIILEHDCLNLSQTLMIKTVVQIRCIRLIKGILKSQFELRQVPT